MHNDATTVRIPKEIDEYLNRITKEQNIKKSTAIRMIIAERMMKDEKRGKIKPLTKDTPRNKRTKNEKRPRSEETPRIRENIEKPKIPQIEEKPKIVREPTESGKAEERDYFKRSTGTDFSDWTEEQREEFERQFGKH